MKFTHTIFYVSDVAASMAFYEKAFRIKQKFIHEEGIYGEMDTGETALAFASNAIAEKDFPAGFVRNKLQSLPHAMEIVFETVNVDESFSYAVSQGAIPLTDPKDMHWGQRVSRVRDLDGIIVEICSPMVNG